MNAGAGGVLGFARRALRSGRSIVSGARRKADARLGHELRIIEASGLFDARHYLDRYPDVAAAGMEPLLHYVRHGAWESRSPNSVFDSGFYLETYADVAAAHVNPLAHYAEHGWKELRNPSAGFNAAWYWLIHMAGDPEAGDPLAHYLTTGAAGGVGTSAPTVISASDRRRIDLAVARVLASSRATPHCCIQLGEFLSREKLWTHAEPVYRRLIGFEWDVASHHERLANVLGAQGRWWQQAEVLATAIQLDSANASLQYRLGAAHEAMERWEDAADAYRRSLKLQPANVDARYRLAYVLDRKGSPKARDAYVEVVAKSADADVVRYGVGVLHQARHYWKDAAKSYARRLEEEPLDAHLHFRLGMAYDRCYQWLDAVRSFQMAIALKPGVSDWHYRLGFAFERLHEWEQAAGAYGDAIAVSAASKPYWQYRRAIVLMKSGDHERAARTFLGDAPEVRRDAAPMAIGSDRIHAAVGAIEQALNKDFTRADWHYLLGEQHERQGNWRAAAAAYQDALDREDLHRPDWYLALGRVLYEAGDYSAACEVLRETKIAGEPYGVDFGRYEKDPVERNLLAYERYSRDLPIRTRTILYESFAGAAIGCNPRAMFRKLIGDPEFSGWIHVWVIADRNAIPDEYRGLRNVVFVTRDSDLYLRYVATAGFLINNATFPAWFSRREGQKYLNTWHGTPLKTLGKDIKGSFMERKNTARNFLHATHILSPNAHTTEVLVGRYDVEGILSARVAETGYPRVDPVMEATEADRAATRRALGLKEGLPVVVYAPTWRGVLGDAIVDLDCLRAAITAMGRLKCQVVFRGHYFSEHALRDLGVPAIIAPYSVDTSELLAIADVLVTDYSSIVFDYLPLRKPIIYFAYDYARYEESRGLYFPMARLPGDLCTSGDELLKALGDVIAGKPLDMAAYDRAISEFCANDDGNATGRAIDFFLKEAAAASGAHDGRKNLLIYAGAFPPNGITTSCLNLLAALDPSRYRVVLAIDPDAVEQFDARMGKFAELPEWVQVVARCGRMLVNPEERWIIQRSGETGASLPDEMWGIYMDVHAREYRRLFGGARFDAVVQFDGYSQFWTAALLGSGQDVRKAIYLHNDMREEAEIRFPSLKSVFRMYDEYDALVSVSSAMSDTNRSKLAEGFGIDAGKFTFAENVINHEALVSKAGQPLDPDIARWMGSGMVFLAMGRMSPEKDHPKLIRAFAEVRAARPDAKLVLLGDGPLRPELEQMISALALDDAVLLAGQRSNPFPALKACGCFVLSSNHEGQPMVLLEALVLGKPIVATDIDGNRGALAGRGGLLVNNTAEGLARGMLDFAEGKVVPSVFDATSYRASALRHFDEVISRKHA